MNEKAFYSKINLCFYSSRVRMKIDNDNQICVFYLSEGGSLWLE